MAADLLEPGFRLGKYEVQAHIATGGMGEVYKALDVELGRTVALKVLPAPLAENSRTLERFRHEARHAAMLNHANIVTLFECGFDAAVGLNYLAMEFIDGIDLEDHIKRRGRLPPSEVRHILIRVARALGHAFDRGMVHRDIKPSNILLARADGKVVVKLTDLGLARLVDDEDYKVTRDGSTVGTIDYLSPEQARDSRSADIRSDIYSLGCTAYHMLAGKPPFAGGGLGQRIYKHMHEEPDDIRQFSARVSDDFWAIVGKMLEKNPDDRYQTPAELLAELKRLTPEASAREAKKSTLNRKDKRRSRHEPTPTPYSSPLSGTVDGLPAAPAQSVPKPAAPPSPLPVEAETESARAAAFHERAIKTLSGGGSNDYARELLESCLALEPFNPGYRKTFREFNRKVAAGGIQRWIGPLSAIGIRSRLHQAKANGQWRKVLDHGEELLARQPSDVEAHLEMATAAMNLHQPALVHWLLQQGLSHTDNPAELLRGMARLYEERNELKLAIAALQKVCELDPTDRLSRLKLNDLTAQEHLAGGFYQR
jgi:serine/threonine protein kinase